MVVAVPGWGVPLARPIVWRSPGLTGGPGSRQVPGGSWGGCPSSRACAGHSGLLGSSLDPDPTWHSAGSLWVTALCLRRLLSPGAADRGVTSDPEAEHRHFRDLRPRRSEAWGRAAWLPGQRSPAASGGPAGAPAQAALGPSEGPSSGSSSSQRRERLTAREEEARASWRDVPEGALAATPRAPWAAPAVPSTSLAQQGRAARAESSPGSGPLQRRGPGFDAPLVRWPPGRAFPRRGRSEETPGEAGFSPAPPSAGASFVPEDVSSVDEPRAAPSSRLRPLGKGAETELPLLRGGRGRARGTRGQRFLLCAPRAAA